MIYIIRDRATPEQMQDMLEVLGELHVDCEQTLLNADSEQANVQGADWYPFQQRVGYESIINIRPSANNRSMEIQDAVLRNRIDRIVRLLLGGVQWQ